jgi:hypothetical protein
VANKPKLDLSRVWLPMNSSSSFVQPPPTALYLVLSVSRWFCVSMHLLFAHFVSVLQEFQAEILLYGRQGLWLLVTNGVQFKYRMSVGFNSVA